MFHLNIIPSLLQEALLPALEALSPEQFEWAMSLVHARYPGLPSGPGEEMQFDITCLDSLALRQLMDLTNACAKAAKVCHASPYFAWLNAERPDNYTICMTSHCMHQVGCGYHMYAASATL